jgi:hypothetical protein
MSLATYRKKERNSILGDEKFNPAMKLEARGTSETTKLQPIIAKISPL